MTEKSKNEKCEACLEIQYQSLLTEGKDYSLSSRGKIMLGVFGAAVVGMTAAVLPFLAPGVRKICLPFLPASEDQVANVLTILSRNQRGKLVDLGSGDGRIVIAAAKKGYMAVGVELNPWLVLYSRYKAWREGVHRNTAFKRKDMFKEDFTQYDHVVVFGVEYLMDSLEEKVLKEAKPDCDVVACRFAFPNLHQVATVGYGIDAVWRYTPTISPEPPRKRNEGLNVDSVVNEKEESW